MCVDPVNCGGHCAECCADKDNLLSQYIDLQVCDCCEGLFDEVFDADGHMQCRTCTSMAGEIKRLTIENRHLTDDLEDLRKAGQRIIEEKVVLEAAHALNVEMYEETGGAIASSELANNSRKATKGKII